MDAIKYYAESHLNPITEANPLYLSSIKYTSPLHYHDYYEIFLITKGRTIHIVNGERQLLPEGSLVSIRPDDTHFYDYDGNNDCEFINIPVSEKFVFDSFNYLGMDSACERLLMPKLPPYVILPIVQKNRFIDSFSKLHLLSLKDMTQTLLQIRCMLIEMLTCLFAEQDIDTSANIPIWLEELLVKMQRKENFTEGLAKMYLLAGCTPGHLHKVMKKYFNTTPTSYINELRLDYSRSLLLNTHMSVLDIAMEAGFGNLSHFYHLFKAKYNISPSDSRRKR
jgi:AraC family transcriptional regulator, dual regulator of chb operon